MGKKSRKTKIIMATPELHNCPKCEKDYKPKYPSKDASPEYTIWREQYCSGICSDECWEACSEDEILQFKFVKPRYQQSCQKLIVLKI